MLYFVFDTFIERLRIEIKQALQEKANQKALLHLKRVKMLSEIVKKRSHSLFTIEQIIEKINSAETEEKVNSIIYLTILIRYYKLIPLAQMRCILFYLGLALIKYKTLWIN